MLHCDLVDLRLFLHVAEAGNITHAARQSNLALASASERIRGMEDTAGVELLIRGRRGVTLTPAGRAMAHHARLVLQQFDALRSEMADFAGGLRGQVRLAANTAAAMEFLPDVLSAFLAAQPGIDVDVEERSSHDIIRLVAEGFVDIGIAADIVDFAGLTAFPFATDRLVAVLPPRHPLGGAKLRFRDLLDEDFVGLSADSALQQHLSQHAMQSGKPLKLRTRLSSFEAICRMVAHGVGVSVMPETAARRGRRTMKLRICRLEDAWSVRRLHVCLRDAEHLPPTTKLLLEHLLPLRPLRRRGSG